MEGKKGDGVQRKRGISKTRDRARNASRNSSIGRQEAASSHTAILDDVAIEQGGGLLMLVHLAD
jgi:hypothetical protein